MAIAKWMPFATAQPVSETTKSNPVVPVVTSADAKKFGLENFGNTCYANSVLQALYFCAPFRELILRSEGLTLQDRAQQPSSVGQPPPLGAVPGRRKSERKYSSAGQSIDALHANPQPNTIPIPPTPATLFSALRSLFLFISKNPADTGTVAPRAFIDKLKEVNELFRSNLHQDAHEFLNYLLNKIVEEIEEERKRQQDGTLTGDDLSASIATLSTKTAPTCGSNSGTSPQDATLVHKLFEGVLTSETRCLTCETVSSRDESFLDLSIDIEQNSSVTACLKQFSASEMLCQRNKFFCDACCDLQEAEKRMKIKKLPNILALHLKRFKYQEDVQKYIKLAYRVAFPFELRLFNTVDDTDDADRLYELFAIVVHIGIGPHHGHYISLIKTQGSWVVFDDDAVDTIKESDIPKYFGESNSGSAYVLYYQAVDIDLVGLGLRHDTPETAELHPPLSTETPPLPAPAHPPGLDSNLSDSNDVTVVPPPEAPQPLIKETLPPPNLITDLEASSSSSPGVTTAAAVNNAKESFLRTLRRGPSTKVRTGAMNGPENRGSVDGLSRPPMPSGPLPLVTNGDLGPPLLPTKVSAKDNGKEVEKKSGTWFKRKSQRMRGDHFTEPTSSTMPPHRGDDGNDFPWFRASGHLPKHKNDHRPSEPGLVHDHSFPQSQHGSASVTALSLKPPDDHASGYESSPGSASSSRSTSLAHTPVEPPRSPLSPTSALLPGTARPPPPLGRSPKQKKSASQINGLHTIDRESPVSAKFPIRPLTSGGSGSRVTAQSLPPLPPLPPPLSHFRRSHEDHASNGHAVERDAQAAAARGRSRPSGGVDEVPDLHSHTAHGSVGLGSFADSNQSTSTSSSGASSNVKKPKRKMSLTAPILGFGRKDKDKDKQKEEKVKSSYHATAYPMPNRL